MNRRLDFGQNRIGILAALDQELEGVLSEVDETGTEQIAGRSFHSGELHGQKVVAVVAGIGKTAAAVTTTLLIDHFASRRVVLYGAAGKVSPELSVGDVVIANDLVHHDFDASPLFPPCVIPSLQLDRLPADRALSDLAFTAACRFITDNRAGGLAKVHRGLVLSGDQFMKPDQIAELRGRFPDGLAVEMEGAAVAQTCLEFDVPLAVIRTISDGGGVDDFKRFLENDCSAYAKGIIGQMMREEA